MVAQRMCKKQTTTLEESEPNFATRSKLPQQSLVRAGLSSCFRADWQAQSRFNQRRGSGRQMSMAGEGCAPWGNIQQRYAAVGLGGLPASTSSLARECPYPLSTVQVAVPVPLVLGWRAYS